jgi:hypothetical protein
LYAPPPEGGNGVPKYNLANRLASKDHESAGRAHGTYEIEKYEWVSMERK